MATERLSNMATENKTVDEQQDFYRYNMTKEGGGGVM